MSEADNLLRAATACRNANDAAWFSWVPEMLERMAATAARGTNPTDAELASAILAERDRLDAVVHELLGEHCPVYVSGGYLEWLAELEVFAAEHGPMPLDD